MGTEELQGLKPNIIELNEIGGPWQTWKMIALKKNMQLPLSICLY